MVKMDNLSKRKEIVIGKRKIVSMVCTVQNSENDAMGGDVRL